ncbi:Rieske (2Fe-2S) protein [Paenibacillus agricola]|uniref:Rieske (2Fe-2S) protein n=1 Tax=Paenibacillus agricola TaxID=2716264 RepID=A0ABX0J501_9BACL|nr:Rieske (2Fe-2S) protein [Paenibacillus agricola]NHN30505.1 Rieske (2Fe-2S) protein [Paenibacillus agricola]
MTQPTESAKSTASKLPTKFGDSAESTPASRSTKSIATSKSAVGHKHKIGLVSEIPPGSHKIVVAGGRSLGVYNLNGQFYALRNICPHQGAELCKGLTKPLVVSSAPGRFEYEREGEIIRCPWHQWEFDIKTGCQIVDPEVRIKSYEVTVEEVAVEKFDVSVEDGAVIVHM